MVLMDILGLSACSDRKSSLIYGEYGGYGRHCANG